MLHCLLFSVFPIKFSKKKLPYFSQPSATSQVALTTTSCISFCCCFISMTILLFSASPVLILFVSVWYPVKVTTRLQPPLGNCSLKLPAASVAVPIVVFSANTDAESMGSFVSASIILPVTSYAVWELAERETINANTKGRNFFIRYFFTPNYCNYTNLLWDKLTLLSVKLLL